MIIDNQINSDYTALEENEPIWCESTCGHLECECTCDEIISVTKQLKMITLKTSFIVIKNKKSALFLIAGSDDVIECEFRIIDKIVEEITDYTQLEQIKTLILDEYVNNSIFKVDFTGII